MTTPPGPDEPRYATGYGGARYPLPPEGAPGSPAPQPYPGAQPYPAPQQHPTGQYPPGQQDQPTGGYPYGQQQYSPYGPSPAGTGGDPAPVRRPGSVVLGLVLMALAALPFLAFGLLLLLVPIGPELFPPDVLATPGLDQIGITSMDQLVGFVRAMGAVLIGPAVVYLVIAVVGFLGRNWARILTAVLTGGFALFLLLTVVSAIAVDPLSAVFLAVPLVLSVAGIILWFMPQASRWYANR